ncbi:MULTISPECIES: alpha/beta fold hydrolase [unclassified Rhodococcus (in: high G+C Gram-positive bacteria)]|uniref:alpha/beta fold hydrolase n=1 Tax=unclassified Rhodococcus (in: high G+C Gram-positive bacteria) TaxID=192944 RepID=UPI001639B344|nr:MULTISPECIES: alpha/beta fold hydrolase [unclassified Rhodococcus (in: high G+C Gram-positive bacteria)]MBC2637757.1 alpha/beta fold hydrolase [Rhodococcus sp. 3A]MBC2897498.1 alpha/beta fold hydrolase [Rhodococcus sp. 4CII]
MMDSLSPAKFERVGSFRTRYYDFGVADAPVLVLLHDGAWGGSASVTWERIAAPLAERYRVIAPDLLGFGATDKAVFLGESPYDFRIRHVFDLLRHLGVTSAIHLIGNSFGGSLALRAAGYGTHTADIADIEIKSVASINGTGGPWRTQLALDELGWWDGTRADLERVVRLLIDDGQDFASHVDQRLEQATTAGHYRAVKAPTLALPDALRLPKAADSWPEPLRTCESPVLLVSGKRDPLLEPEWTSRLQSVLPHCEVEQLDCTHAPNIDHPDELLQVLTQFLLHSETTTRI